MFYGNFFVNFSRSKKKELKHARVSDERL